MFLDVRFIELDLLKNNQMLCDFYIAGGSFSLVYLINYFQSLKKRKKYCHLPKKDRNCSHISSTCTFSLRLLRHFQ